MHYLIETDSYASKDCDIEETEMISLSSLEYRVSYTSKFPTFCPKDFLVHIWIQFILVLWPRTVKVF